jgi:radical SAM superfamily enzyme YgiQ (UPF0313 family)
MKRVLFVTFDFHELNKPIKSIAVASLETYLKKKIDEITISSFSFNMNDEYTIAFDQMNTLSTFLEEQFDYICVSMYAWNMMYINLLFDEIRSLQKNTKIICGGYEVNSSTIHHITKKYPFVNQFIIGYAEEGLFQAISEKDTSKVLSYEVNNEDIPAIYKNEIIRLTKDSIVRLETKRGCPGKCTFCSYKNNDHKNLTCHNFDKVKKELKYLNNLGVSKVNIIDAIFTILNYKEILAFLVEIDFKPIVSLQMKFELFHNELSRNQDLLKILNQLNVELEFGLQSINKVVLENVERRNNLDEISDTIHLLNENDIKYEVSIIRGLPGETVDSFKQLIEFLKDIKCQNYTVFPLTLLTNTKLHAQIEEFDLKIHKQNGLDYVIGSTSYNYKDYIHMLKLENI